MFIWNEIICAADKVQYSSVRVTCTWLLKDVLGSSGITDLVSLYHGLINWCHWFIKEGLLVVVA